MVLFYFVKVHNVSRVLEYSRHFWCSSLSNVPDWMRHSLLTSTQIHRLSKEWWLQAQNLAVSMKMGHVLKHVALFIFSLLQCFLLPQNALYHLLIWCYINVFNIIINILRILSGQGKIFWQSIVMYEIITAIYIVLRGRLCPN